MSVATDHDNYSSRTSGQQSTIWLGTETPSFPSLNHDETADVCVVGGGMAGLTLAYLLQNEGKKVVLLESRQLCSGETGRTTAHLMTSYDDRYFHMKKMHGEKGAKLVADSQVRAIDMIESIIKKEKIECEFKRVDGYLFLCEEHKVSQPDLIDEEYKATLDAGLAARMVDRAPIKDFDTGSAILYPGNGQFDPVKYLSALAKVISQRGAKIYTSSHVSEIKGGDDAFVKTENGHTVHCDNIAICTNHPINDILSISTLQESMRSYVVCAKVPKGYVPQALYWDTLDPYHYARLQHLEENCKDFNILIIGGEDHRVGEQKDDQDYIEERYKKLEEWGRKYFPQMTEIVNKWSGQVQEPNDGLPYVGNHPVDHKNVFIISGDSGQGMTSCTSGAMLITDKIMGRPNDWETLFNPTRLPKGPTDLIKDGLGTFKEYLQWVTSSDVKDVEDILPDHGAVLRKDGSFAKHACYRDCDGCLYEMSAVCTHLGGIVVWNDNEKSFDCGCHGSRFDKYGKVICGPANSDLVAINENVKKMRQSLALKK